MTLLLIQLIVAHNSYEDENGDDETLSLELVHRHDSRFGGDDVDQVEAIKGFIQRDLFRREQMDHRKGINQGHHRRKDMEVKKEFQMSMHSGRDYAVGEYFVEVEVGTPGQSFWLVADTGKDLSGVFSLSYCPNNSDPCLFDISYADGSSATGYFGVETISVNLTNGGKGKLENVTIGCTLSVLNGITFTENTGGILGLGFTKGSFVDRASLKYNTKFSYCLVDHLSHRNVSSYLTFGNPKVKLLDEMKTTELFLYQPFYGVNVTGISVGREMLKIPPTVWDFQAEGGMIIDSGTTLAALVLEAYDPVVEALTNSLKHVKRVDKSLGDLDFCFESEGFDPSSMPSLVFHFGGGVKFAPPVKSYVIDFGPNVKCLGFVPINGTGVSVIGNIMQQSHLWQIDVYQNTVSFAPSRCG
ncbi:hypothetical protein KIW84_010367 [Lathyrus oleraceus]|uniref:Peptidase A1 domain-containing protein n=1 Tax=Pisum sativum TaxID=3888 RepID=A0A9D4YL19_PEA|nr:hypothetical protein KIW84_010367 [Pisum sativum]